MTGGGRGTASFSILVTPTQLTALTYNGEEQALTLNGYDPSASTISGTTEATEAGTYEAYVTPKQSYFWADNGNAETRTIVWTIDRQSTEVPALSSSAFTYDGKAKTPTWSNYDADKMTITGDVSGTNAGDYSVTFAPGDNYCWPDSTYTAKMLTWSIGRASISTVPSQSGSLTYTGSSQSPSWNSYDSVKMALGGTTSGTNAGTYSATFTPTSNYCWSDSATTAKTVSWSIGKADGTMSISDTSLALSIGDHTAVIAVTRAGDGVVSASSSNTDVATVSVAGTSVTVTARADGTAVITVEVAEGTNHKAPSKQTCTVSSDFPTSILNDNTWAMINGAAYADLAQNYWSVGDCKAVELSGTVGYLKVSGTYYVYILGFDHDGDTGTIDFGTFKTALSGGTDVCLVDSVYNSYYTKGDTYFNPNHWGYYCYGGWSGSDIRYDVLGSTDRQPFIYGAVKTDTNVGYDASAACTTSPVSNTLMEALPSELRAVMQPMAIYTFNVITGSTGAAKITPSVDYLPLPAEYEIFGTRTYADSYEQNRQTQYEYYASGNAKVKYKHNATTTTAYWWERSPQSDSSLCCTDTSGTAKNSTGYYSYGLAPIFRVGRKTSATGDEIISNIAAITGTGVVTLSQDVSNNCDISVQSGQEIILDMNGNTLNGNITVADGGSLTLADFSQEQIGKFTGTLPKSVDGTFHIKRGNYPSNPAAFATLGAITNSDATYTHYYTLKEAIVAANATIAGGATSSTVYLCGNIIETITDKLSSGVTINSDYGKISGGTYIFDPTDYLSDDVKTILEHDSTYSVYTTLQATVNAAVAGENIRVVRSDTTSVKVSKTITITKASSDVDLNVSSGSGYGMSVSGLIYTFKRYS
jgi:hypothetical protein